MLTCDFVSGVVTLSVTPLVCENEYAGRRSITVLDNELVRSVYVGLSSPLLWLLDKELYLLSELVDE